MGSLTSDHMGSLTSDRMGSLTSYRSIGYSDSSWVRADTILLVGL